MKTVQLSWLITGVIFMSLSDSNHAQPARQQTDDTAGSVTSDGGVDLVMTPIVIAHRGASGYLPEHTTEGVAMAHTMGADYIEQDVVLSRDGIPVVLHDLYLDDISNVSEVFPDRRQSDGRFYVMDFLLAELRQLTLHERSSPSRAWKDRGTRFPQQKGHFHIGTLAEHLQLIQGLNQSRKREAGVYVEIKDPEKHHKAGLDSATATLKVLTDFGYTQPDDAVFLQCFDPTEVRRVRTELDCRLPIIQLLAEMPTPDQIREYSMVADGLGVPITMVISGVDQNGDPIVTSLVESAHSLAMQVHVWTFRLDAMPEFAPDAQTLISWLVRDGGVDGIFADHPDAVLNWRAQNSQDEPPQRTFRLLNDH